MSRDMGMTYWLEKAEAEMRELGRRCAGTALTRWQLYHPGHGPTTREH
jgi:hypothetical protein